MLGTKEIERLAGWTTRAGLTTEIAGVKEVAAPYMEMNTKELLLEGAKLVKMGGVEVRPNPSPNPDPDPDPNPNPNQVPRKPWPSAGGVRPGLGRRAFCYGGGQRAARRAHLPATLPTALVAACAAHPTARGLSRARHQEALGPRLPLPAVPPGAQLRRRLARCRAARQHAATHAAALPAPLPAPRAPLAAAVRRRPRERRRGGPLTARLALARAPRPSRQGGAS